MNCQGEMPSRCNRILKGSLWFSPIFLIISTIFLVLVLNFEPAYAAVTFQSQQVSDSNNILIAPRPSVVRDANGVNHMSAVPDTIGLSYFTGPGNSFNTELIDSNGRCSNIFLDPQGRTCVVFASNDGICYAIRTAANSWSKSRISDVFGWPFWAVMGSDGIVRVAFSGDDDLLYYTSSDQGTNPWVIEPVGAASSAGNIIPRIGVDADNNPYILRVQDNTLYLSSRIDGAWQEYQLYTPPQDSSKQISLLGGDFFDNGRLWLAFAEKQGDKAVLHWGYVGNDHSLTLTGSDEQLNWLYGNVPLLFNGESPVAVGYNSMNYPTLMYKNQYIVLPRNLGGCNYSLSRGADGRLSIIYVNAAGGLELVTVEDLLEDKAPPQIIESVSTDNIMVTFNEEIKAGPHYSSITLNSGGTDVPIIASISGNVLLIQAGDVQLDNSGTLTIPAGAVSDLANNLFSSPIVLPVVSTSAVITWGDTGVFRQKFRVVEGEGQVTFNTTVQITSNGEPWGDDQHLSDSFQVKNGHTYELSLHASSFVFSSGFETTATTTSPNANTPAWWSSGNARYTFSSQSIELIGPDASFTVTSEHPVKGEEMIFDASNSTDSTGTITSFDWDFGDGSEGTGQQVSHTFVEAGNYIVTLTVTDQEGASDTETRIVEVAGEEPAEVIGDVNLDGNVNGFDALDILLNEGQLFSQVSAEATQTLLDKPEIGDVNGDSSVNGFDALDVLLYEANLFALMSEAAKTNLGV